MEEFHKTMQSKLGVHLTQPEVIGLLRRYKPEFTHDGKIQTDTILQDIKKLMNNSQKERYRYDPSDVLDSSYTVGQVLALIKEKLSIKAGNVRGSNLYQKAFIIFGNNRSAYLSKEELKSALIFRLALTLHEVHVHSIFNLLDKNDTGFIRTKEFIDLIYKSNTNIEESYLDISISGEKRNEKILSSMRPTSYVDYSDKFQKLFSPVKSECCNITVNELEEKICNKIVEKVNSGQNIIQSVVKAFGDDRESRMLHRITLEQLKFTIWNKFQFSVNESVILELFNRYDREGKGFIALSKFIDVSDKSVIQC